MKVKIDICKQSEFEIHISMQDDAKTFEMVIETLEGLIQAMKEDFNQDKNNVET